MNKYYMFYRYPCASILMLVLLPCGIAKAKRWMQKEFFCYDDLARLTASGGEANTCHDEFVYDNDVIADRRYKPMIILISYLMSMSS